MSESNNGNGHKTSLGAYLSPLAVVALSFGYAVGWGSFVMPGAAFLPGAGPLGTTIGILIGAAAMLVFALNYHRMAKRLPGSGGAFTFAMKAFGADHGFLLAWFLFLTYVAILWANATAIVLLVRYLFGSAFQFGLHYTMAGFDVYFGEALLCVLAIALCGGVCILRKRLAIGLNTLLAGVFVASVAACLCAALWRHGGGLSAMAPAFAPEGNHAIQVLRIIDIVPWAFVGFEAIVNSSGEFRFPAHRTFWLLAVAVALSAAAYIALALLPVIALPDGYTNWSDYIAALPTLEGIDAMPVFAAAKKALGQAGVAVIGGAMLAAQLTGVIATFIATSRLLYAMGEAEMIPRWFSALNRDGSPSNALLFVMCASAALPFLGRTVTTWAVDVSAFGAAIAYGYTSAAAFAVTEKKDAFRKFGARAAGLLGVAMSVVFSLMLLVPDYIAGDAFASESYLLLAVWCILGFLLYRRVFRHDATGVYGKSMVVWVGVIVMIFFATLMWGRLTICETAECVCGDLMGTTVTKESVSAVMRHVNSDMLKDSVVELLLLVSSLAIVMSLFSILRKRENALVLAKLDAEKSASKSRSYFFSTVSHDIRTPLNAIIGFSQMLKMGFKTDEERDQAVDSILLSGKTLLCLINDVLDFSKLESGRMEIVPEPTDCRHLMHEIVESFRIANKKPGLEIRSKIGEMPALMLDPQRIRQMLFNFVGNAAKFTDAGYIEVRATFEADVIKQDSGTFRLEVEDTGIGIGEEDLKLISQPYVQVRMKGARHGGTGLGLSICRQLATAMGGEMSIASTPGKGSTFTVTIPNVAISAAAPAEEAKTVENEIVRDAAEHIANEIRKIEQNPLQDETAVPVPAAPPPAAAKRRVLVADDQKMNLMVLKALLSKLGSFDIVTAADGKEALAKLEAPDAQPFDLVLTDMWMPEMDGKGLVHEIRADPKLASLPTYVVTADVEVLKHFETTGFSGVVLKPVTVDKLKEIL